MAGLSSTGIWGFISSALPTGKRDAKGKPDMKEHFLSGMAGYGWKIWERVKGKFCLEIDQVVVRGTMTVFELLISKIRALKGALAITQASGKIKSVTLSEDGGNYLITLEEDMAFVTNDFVRCQTFTGGQHAYHVKVKVEGETIVIAKTEFALDEEGYVIDPPRVGDELIQFGNATDTSRQSAIYLHADESGQPAIDVMFGINSKDWTNCVKVRAGGDIPGSGGLKGFYCENGMIKSANATGEVMYCLYPDGTAYLGAGAAIFRADRSGHIAGGAISWSWDNTKGKYVCNMTDVELQWGNLSDEVKENLKGEPGTDANLLPWIEEWNDNKVQIVEDNLVSPRMFSGTNSGTNTNPILTGVAFGRECVEIDGVKRTGIFGVKENKPVFEIDALTGNAGFCGNVDAISGCIGELEIVDGEIIGKNSEGKTCIRVSKKSLSEFSELNNVSVEDVLGRSPTNTLSYDVFIDYIREEWDHSREEDWIYTNASKELVFESERFSVIDSCHLSSVDIYPWIQTTVLTSGAILSTEVKSAFLIDCTTGMPVVGALSMSRDGIGTGNIPEAGSYYLRICVIVSIDYTNGVRLAKGVNSNGTIYYDVDIRAQYSQKCTLIGADGIYSYWGTSDYLYAKRGANGQLDIKMKGNIEIADRSGKVLLKG